MPKPSTDTRRRRASDFPYLDHPGPIPFAHRGGASAAPENTMPAFQQAIDLGFRYLETDVHATADGVLVAFHDDRLDRVTNSKGVISELPWSEVQNARVDGAEPIPLLADLLTSFPEARLNIDAKSNEAVAPLVRELIEHQAIDRVCVGSFSDTRLATVRAQMGPRLCTSFGPAGVLSIVAASLGAPDQIPEGACAQVPMEINGKRVISEAFVAYCHSIGLQVHVWTIDDPGDMAWLLDIGVDGIMTDEPQVLKTVFQARTIWSG